MRSYQVFASLAPEQATRVLSTLAEKAPVIYAQAVAAAALAMKARPVYLKRQTPEKRAQVVRRSLSRVTADPVAAEVLAVYFLECRQELLVEWLDALGLEHDEGILTADAPEQPADAALTKTIDAFLAADGDDPDRKLLLAAFSAQDAIDWPALEARLGGQSAS